MNQGTKREAAGNWRLIFPAVFLVNLHRDAESMTSRRLLVAFPLADDNAMPLVAVIALAKVVEAGQDHRGGQDASRMRKLKAVITNRRLVTPTGKFNVYNTTHDIY